MKFEIEIDPALLVRDGREFGDAEFRAVDTKDIGKAYTLDHVNGRPRLVVLEDLYFHRLIIREKRWVPRLGEECLFLGIDDDGDFALKQRKWNDTHYEHTQLNHGRAWPLYKRADALACVERVKAAIKGGAE